MRCAGGRCEWRGAECARAYARVLCMALRLVRGEAVQRKAASAVRRVRCKRKICYSAMLQQKGYACLRGAVVRKGERRVAGGEAAAGGGGQRQCRRQAGMVQCAESAVSVCSVHEVLRPARAKAQAPGR